MKRASQQKRLYFVDLLSDFLKKLYLLNNSPISRNSDNSPRDELTACL